MARTTAPSDLMRNNTLAALAELASDCAGERMRQAEAARILVLARRVAATGAGDAADPASRAVHEIARHWDPMAVTAQEYAESLPAVVLDRLLRAAPAWAACVIRPELRRAA